MTRIDGRQRRHRRGECWAASGGKESLPQREETCQVDQQEGRLVWAGRDVLDPRGGSFDARIGVLYDVYRLIQFLF